MRRTNGWVVAALVATGAMVPVGPAAPAVADVGACSSTVPPGFTSYVWSGDAGTTDFGTAFNWEGGQVPDNTGAATSVICIDAVDDGNPGTVVELDGNVETQAYSLDVRSGTTLLVSEGGKLFVHADPADAVSHVRAGAALRVEGSTVGGPGTIELQGSMTWRSLVSGAATLTSDPCRVVSVDCVLTTQPGRLVVADAGLLTVDGRGVNLFDRYTVEVRGRMVLTGPLAYVSADRGTTVELRPRAGTGGGVFDIRNDGAMYEGRPQDSLGLARLVNQGVLLKSAGTGVSAVSADYSQPSGGRVVVRSGTLTLPDGTARAASVGRGDTYGTGRCPAFAVVGCVPQTTPDDPELARFTVPDADRNGARVTVVELPGQAGPADVGDPVRFHAVGLRKRAVATLQLRYDDAIVGSRTKSTMRILRQPDGSARSRPVPSCRRSGALPRGAKSCVWRQRSRNLGGGDVLMVVRTTVTSRWRGR
jgi:hypothetical protein